MPKKKPLKTQSSQKEIFVFARLDKKFDAENLLCVSKNKAKGKIKV